MTKRLNEREVIELIDKEADIIIPIANGEPHRLLDILEENYTKLHNVNVHQMLALKERDYILGKMKGHLSHVSYFLSGATRGAYYDGHIKLVPNVFHDVPRLLKNTTKMSMIMAVASPMDEHGYFSLGTGADYVV